MYIYEIYYVNLFIIIFTSLFYNDSYLKNCVYLKKINFEVDLYHK